MPTKESKADFEKLISKHDPKIRVLAKKMRGRVLKIFPDANEKTYWGWRNTWYGFSEKASDAVFTISPVKAYMQLYFMRGTELSDPDKLLEGTGKKLRHSNIRNASELKRPALLRLMKRAVAHGKREGKVKTKSKSQKPKFPKKTMPYSAKRPGIGERV
ncbi:MAG: DUF1801 domain-containing protein [Chloroflexi bacterium]|nr:DUF1801 domain-containing protein [Chloroflexota bacterium]